MPAVAMSEIVGPASAAGRGAGAFNVIGIEHAEAIVTGAEAARAPVVLAISQNCVAYHGALEPIAAAVLAVAGAAAVPVAVHLDHATGEDLVHAAAAAKIGSVMYDASALPYPDNVAATARVTRWCHDRGIWTEAELGEIGGKDGVHSARARTKPDEAAGYAAATGVDALAVGGQQFEQLIPAAVTAHRRLPAPDPPGQILLADQTCFISHNIEHHPAPSAPRGAPGSLPRASTAPRATASPPPRWRPGRPRCISSGRPAPGRRPGTPAPRR